MNRASRKVLVTEYTAGPGLARIRIGESAKSFSPSSNTDVQGQGCWV